VPITKRPLLTGTIAATILAGSVLIAPFSVAANASQAAGHASGATQSQTRYAHVAFSIRLEDQLLATLHYLPVTFVPAGTKKTTTTTTTTTTTSTTTTTAPGTTTTTTTTTTPGTTTTTVPTTTTTHPKPKPKPVKKPSRTALQKGTFVWRYKHLTGPIRSLWKVGTNNVVLQGALMNFQAVHGFAWNGGINTPTWEAIVKAAAQQQYDPTSYNYVVVSQSQPEKLKLYVAGHHTYTSFVNTGISSAPTASGTYPVYLRYTVTTMSGELPGGGTYHDPGIPWVSYFHGGDALHGFLRSQYGFPQSLGCVEMPFANAKIVWPYTPIGTLVTVT
jgi:L,D-transpeptidase catalytic domain